MTMKKLNPPWVCPVCRKDLRRIAETLGEPALVAWVHKYAHVREAAEAVLKAVEVAAEANPEIARCFARLQEALNL